jgi:hypothetical protein
MLSVPGRFKTFGSGLGTALSIYCLLALAREPTLNSLAAFQNRKSRYPAKRTDQS